MDTPVAAVTAGTKQALDLKTLVAVMIVTLIVVFLVSKIVRKTITIRDSSGNVTGTGTLDDTWVWFKKAA